MLNMNTAKCRTVRAFTKPLTSTPFCSELIDPQSHARHQTEQFVLAGYRNAFGASFSQFMPLLISLSKDKHRAVLGIRSAEQPLFLEQYLNKPIEQYALFRKQRLSRAHIVEVGNLHSNAKQLTLPLFLLTAVSLFFTGYQYLVFSGTEQVIGIIESTGISNQRLASANPNALTVEGDEWGSYYQANPSVVAVALSQVMKQISETAQYQQIFTLMNENIASLTRSLAIKMPVNHDLKEAL